MYSDPSLCSGWHENIIKFLNSYSAAVAKGDGTLYTRAANSLSSIYMPYLLSSTASTVEIISRADSSSSVPDCCKCSDLHAKSKFSNYSLRGISQNLSRGWWVFPDKGRSLLPSLSNRSNKRYKSSCDIPLPFLWIAILCLSSVFLYCFYLFRHADWGFLSEFGRFFRKKCHSEEWKRRRISNT